MGCEGKKTKGNAVFVRSGDPNCRQENKRLGFVERQFATGD